MDEDGNKIVWVVVIVAAVAVIGGVIVHTMFPDFMDQIKDYIGTVFGNFSTNTGSNSFIVGSLAGL
jgi:hypothetical protein